MVCYVTPRSQIYPSTMLVLLIVENYKINFGHTVHIKFNKKKSACCSRSETYGQTDLTRHICIHFLQIYKELHACSQLSNLLKWVNLCGRERNIRFLPEYGYVPCQHHHIAQPLWLQRTSNTQGKILKGYSSSSSAAFLIRPSGLFSIRISLERWTF
jgi:hypothetical protein